MYSYVVIFYICLYVIMYTATCWKYNSSTSLFWFFQPGRESRREEVSLPMDWFCRLRQVVTDLTWLVGKLAYTIQLARLHDMLALQLWPTLLFLYGKNAVLWLIESFECLVRKSPPLECLGVKHKYCHILYTLYFFVDTVDERWCVYPWWALMCFFSFIVLSLPKKGLVC